MKKHNAVTISTSGLTNGLSVDSNQILSLSQVTTSANGAMISTDKSKLDGYSVKYYYRTPYITTNSSFDVLLTTISASLATASGPMFVAVYGDGPLNVIGGLISSGGIVSAASTITSTNGSISVGTSNSLRISNTASTFGCNCNVYVYFA